jgi:putative transposase
LFAASNGADAQVVHFSVQGNHIHLIVEATDRRTLSGALKAVQIRIARGLNAIMATKGRRFDDRYHEHVLKTPTEMRNALLYVVGNHAVHLARSGRVPRRDVDPFSSVACDDLIRPPGSWLLREGWLRAPPS